ncbi:MAG: hypothetical protein ACE14S_10755 [Candidatus Bathyarchaeia archaeon]
MENDRELDELRDVYNELWSDAKILAKDIRMSISIYSYAGIVTVFLSLVIGVDAIPSLSAVVSGAGDFWSWYRAVTGLVSVLLTLGIGAILLKWYFDLTKKYSRLIQLEKSLGDK